MPEGDLPFEGEEPQAGYPGSRPMPAARPAPASNRPAAPGAGNRPILLKPRSDDVVDADDDDDLEDEEDTDLQEVLRNAPAWLVSTVFHMLLLIVLGILAFSTTRRNTELQVEVSYVEDLGEQLEDPSVLESTATEIETLPEQMITPPDLTPVEDPLAAPLELPDLSLPLQPTVRATATKIEGPAIGIALQGRQVGTRQALLKKYGGTKGTEKAVEAGLAWLARQQLDNGTWSLLGPYSDGGNSENIPAATAMALLAFLGHGDTHREGQYVDVVSKGVKALLRMQENSGLFSGKMSQQTQMLYTHAQATIVICELYGMTREKSLRVPAQKAVAYCIEAQDTTGGGWRYAPRKDSDTSVTGWFVMALQSARMAGLEIPPEVFGRVTEYLDSAQIDEGRAYGYLKGGLESTSAVSAEGLLCRQYLGWPQNDERLVEGVSSLVKEHPLTYDGGLDQDVYYWYYITQAAHHMEGSIWKDWNSMLRVHVPKRQDSKGPEAGSWSPAGDRWGDWAGRLYTTCLSIYMLEVYYRHLPIYSGYEAIAGVQQQPASEIDPAPAESDDKPDDAPDDAPDAAEDEAVSEAESS
ncbi:MAG: squalene--hopene cyclase [Planctomycetota bacterium]|nr:MAG: squalene--hopene cyclase [Planctomycetota bacterium]